MQFRTRQKSIIAGIVGLVTFLLWQQVGRAQHEKDLSACIAKFEKIRIAAKKAEPVNLEPFQQGYQQMGYRDSKGKVIIPPRFTEARRFYQGRALVADQNWYKGLINSKGEIVVPHRFVGLTDFFDGVAVFQGTREDRNQNGFIDRDGNVLLTFRGVSMYDFVGFKNGRASVYVNEADMPWGFLVPPGNPVPKIYGYIDCTGRIEMDWLGRGEQRK